MPSGPRIIATYVPQAWVGGYAIEVDSQIEFDITDQVLAMGLPAALRLKDDTYESDRLADQLDTGHSGPFYVMCQDAIAVYAERVQG